MIMFARLFGPGEEDQLQFLHNRVILTGAGMICGILGMILNAVGISSIGGILGGIGGIALFVALFLWGFGAIRTLIGFGSIGAIFSGNVVLGVVIFMFCVVAAYFISIFIALIGLYRYIYLRVKFSKIRR